jgi:hypothetical protein
MMATLASDYDASDYDRLSKHAERQKVPEPFSDARANQAIESLIEAPFSHARAR